MLPRSEPQSSRIDLVKVYSYLPSAFLSMMFYALKTCSSVTELRVLFFILVSPLLFFLGLKGEIAAPFGKAVITDRERLRSVTYGAFKTYFCYIKNLRRLTNGSLHTPWVVDAGANIGDFAIAMARKGGNVIALEPGPENYKHLLSNIEANRLTNILPLMVAAHSKLASVTMGGNGSSLHVVSNGAGVITRGIPLDQLLEEFPIKTVDVVKLDVQGHERSVVIGMKSLLERRLVGILVVEVHLVRGVRDRDISSVLESFGYRQVFRDKYLFDQHHLYFTPEARIPLSS